VKSECITVGDSADTSDPVSFVAAGLFRKLTFVCSCRLPTQSIIKDFFSVSLCRDEESTCHILRMHGMI